MVFHFAQKKLNNSLIPCLKVNNNQLKYVTNFNFLGITLDDTLSWNRHVSNISNKLSRTCGVITSLKNYLPAHILKQLYTSLMLPILCYGVCVWGYNNCHRLKVIQKRTLRHISHSKFNAHTKPICKQLNLLLFNDIHSFMLLKLLYKITHKTVPGYFVNFPCFPKVNNTVTRRTISAPAYLSDFSSSLPSFRPTIELSWTNKIVTQRCLRHQIPQIINSNIFPNIVLEKIATHSFIAFTNYTKSYIISNYTTQCMNSNCFSCQ